MPINRHETVAEEYKYMQTPLLFCLFKETFEQFVFKFVTFFLITEKKNGHVKTFFGGVRILPLIL